MPLSGPQEAAFQASVGTSSGQLSLIVAMLVALLMLLWLSWLAYAQLRLWASGEAELFDLAASIVRAAVLVLLLGFLIR